MAKKIPQDVAFRLAQKAKDAEKKAKAAEKKAKDAEKKIKDVKSMDLDNEAEYQRQLELIRYKRDIAEQN